MEIVFVSNFLNHHQFPVAHRLYELTRGNYRFVELMAMPNWIKDSGYPEFSDSPFLIQAWKSEESYKMAINEIDNAEFVFFGGAECLPFVKKRMRSRKLTFEIGERWLKRGLINVFSPRLLKTWYYYRILRLIPDARLCASAYAANDMAMLGIFKNKCFKWGYFPAVDIASVEKGCASDDCVVRILWVARFLDWKHPEKAVLAAKFLRDCGVKFEMNLYGDGPCKNRIAAMIEDLGLTESVFLKGNLPNENIRAEMRLHDIFLMTSDKHEGWGAVVNEAMSQGCMILASKTCGSVPFLITNGVTGLIYENDAQKELNERLLYACSHAEHRAELAMRGQKYVRDMWSPDVAAQRLLGFARAYGNSEHAKSMPIDGPCSPAYAIR
ncbi:MAG: glycosyltransferase [Muribaculaceae bacterium]|nr:glycosyltransferase [Muribaculaceae bacterium]